MENASFNRSDMTPFVRKDKLPGCCSCHRYCCGGFENRAPSLFQCPRTLVPTWYALTTRIIGWPRTAVTTGVIERVRPLSHQPPYYRRQPCCLTLPSAARAGAFASAGQRAQKPSSLSGEWDKRRFETEMGGDDQLEKGGRFHWNYFVHVGSTWRGKRSLLGPSKTAAKPAGFGGPSSDISLQVYSQ